MEVGQGSAPYTTDTELISSVFKILLPINKKSIISQVWFEKEASHKNENPTMNKWKIHSASLVIKEKQHSTVKYWGRNFASSVFPQMASWLPWHYWLIYVLPDSGERALLSESVLILLICLILVCWVFIAVWTLMVHGLLIVMLLLQSVGCRAHGIRCHGTWA